MKVVANLCDAHNDAGRYDYIYSWQLRHHQKIVMYLPRGFYNG